jgi:hypothetical protein
MVRMMKWIAPVAGLALVLGFNQISKAADEAPAGKATVNVTVVDKDGKGVENVRVRLVAAPKPDAAAEPKAAKPQAAGDTPSETPKKSKGGAKAVAEGTTDKDGKVALANVPDGDYTVAAGSKGGPAGKETVKVDGGKDVSVTVTLKDRKPKGGATAGGDAK